MISGLVHEGVMNTLFSVSTICFFIVLVGLCAHWAYRRRSFDRECRAFKDLAPDLVQVIADTAGGVDAQIHNKDRADQVNLAHARTQIQLYRLKIQLGVSVPTDPYTLILKPNHKLFAEVAACAFAGDLARARKIADTEWTKGPWATSDND